MSSLARTLRPAARAVKAAGGYGFRAQSRQFSVKPAGEFMTLLRILRLH